MSRYKCQKCEVEHGTDNMVAYCSSCFNSLRAELAIVTKQRDEAVACGDGIEKEKNAAIVGLKKELAALESQEVAYHDTINKLESRLAELTTMPQDSDIEYALIAAKSCEANDEGDCGTGAIVLSRALTATRARMSECRCWKDEHCPLHSVGIAEAESRVLAEKLRADAAEKEFDAVKDHAEHAEQRFEGANERAIEAEKERDDLRAALERAREALEKIMDGAKDGSLSVQNMSTVAYRAFFASLPAPSAKPAPACTECDGFGTILINNSGHVGCPKCKPASEAKP